MVRKIVFVHDYADDIERMVEELRTSRGNFIVDKTSFLVAFQSQYFELNTASKRAYADKVFFAYRLENPQVHADAKLNQRELVKNPRLVNQIQPRVELSNADIRQLKAIPDQGNKRQFIHEAIRSGKVVYAEQIFVTVQGRKQPRLRDCTGKFCKKI